MYLKPQSTLSKRFNNLAVSTGNQIVNTTATPLLWIDLANNDNRVNIFDYNILLANFNTTGNVGFHIADLNFDGKIDIFDFSLMVGNFGSQGEN